MDKAILGLAEAIEALRSELSAAMDAGARQPMRFVVEPVELTVQAAVSKDANGKIGWSVLGLGSSVGSATTQTLKLTLTPMWKNSALGRWCVTSRSPTCSPRTSPVIASGADL